MTLEKRGGHTSVRKRLNRIRFSEGALPQGPVLRPGLDARNAVPGLLARPRRAPIVFVER